MISLVGPGARLVDAASGDVLAGEELADRVAAAAEQAAAWPGVLFAHFPATVDAIVGYLGALQAGRPICLLDPDLHADLRDRLVARFEPGAITNGKGDLPPGYHADGDVWLRDEPSAVTPHADLALLLTTSGSTGDPKLVRLTPTAVQANAHAIAEALGIDGGEVAITSLPLFYSYGMSVLNSHLISGATVVVSPRTFLEREFWNDVNAYGVTSLAAVPYQYEMLKRLRFDPAKYATLRTLTQAGGRLKAELIVDFHGRMSAVGGRMFVMYGQTEAGPRMTTLPSAYLPAKVGSVGPALPGTTLSIRVDDGSETTDPDVEGEVIFRGPNVMLGYATTAADFGTGDELGGRLSTEDLGKLDADGHLWITGRLKRMGKIFGIRVNLDDVERLLVDTPPVAAIPGDDRLTVFVESDEEQWPAKIKARLAEALGIHSSGFEVRSITALPLLANGKVDYRKLAEEGDA
ncbi:AMP-binding protein [Hamadaea sp. NPDC051192]|uniref:AMP-binding protein n=1 Tax=Hamadaea sp. NPDC051192 TaxID=3154940 RepID=UPI003436B3E2